MKYVKSLNLLDVEAKEIPCITGKGKPTNKTEGAVGSLYMNTNNGDIYKCISVKDGIYTWEITTSIVHVSTDLPKLDSVVSVGSVYVADTSVLYSAKKGDFCLDTNESVTYIITGVSVSAIDNRKMISYAPLTPKVDVKDKISYISVNQFSLNENVLTVDKVGTATNWTTDGNTFTHTSGSAEPLRIALGELTVAGDEWLVTFEFATSITGDNLLYLSFGTEALTQTYNGTNFIAVALRVKENGDDLLLTPVSSFNGTLANLKIQKIDKNGVEPYEFVTDSIITKDRQICKTGFWNVILGTEHTMTNAPNSSRTIVIGHNSLRQLRSGNRNIAIGTFAMSVMESGEQNISIGADSMFNVQKSEGCIAIGKGTMAYGKSLKDNIAIGNGALNGSANSTSFYNIAIGKNAGLSCIGERNIIMGYQCAMELSQGIANVYIGDQCTALNGRNQNTIIGASAKAKGSANRSIAIGYQAETTKENQCVLGGDNIVETLLKGTLIVRGTDGVKRQIAFNTDGSCSWSEVV